MDETELERSRRALLTYYNSQTMTHGGYIIALVIGILTLISRWTTFNENVLIWNIFLFMVSCLLIICAHVVGRALFWGALAYEILNAKLAGPDKDEKTVMFQLHIEARNQVVERNKVAGHFTTSRSVLLLVAEFVLAILLWLVLSRLSSILA